MSTVVDSSLSTGSDLERQNGGAVLEKRSSPPTRDEAQLFYLAELERLAPLMAFIAVGPEVMKYSAKLYFSLAVREPKFAHLYIRLLRFLNEQCGHMKQTSEEEEEEITIQSIVLEECQAAIDQHLLPTRLVPNLKELCGRFFVLRKEESDYVFKLPGELRDELVRLKGMMEAECLAIADPDEEHERQKFRQKKRGIAILFAELFNTGWVPISLFLGVVRSLLQDIPCLLADPRHRLPTRSCCLSPPSPSSTCISISGESSPTFHSPNFDEATIPVPILSGDIYAKHQQEERLFSMELSFEMLRLTSKTLCSTPLGNGFIAAHSARAKYLLDLSTTTDLQTLETLQDHPCVSNVTTAGTRVRRVLVQFATLYEENNQNQV